MSSFDVRIEELKLKVGDGLLDIRVEFNQAYAHRQHEDLTFKHPHGGGPQYLRKALYEGVGVYLTFLAQGVLSTDLDSAAIAVSEMFANRASNNAPVRAANLRGSAHPSVISNGAVIYDRPPAIPRLDPEEIEAINMELQDPHHYYGRWPR